MRSAHTSRRQAEASFDGIDADYDDVFAVQADSVGYRSAAELADVVDLLDEVERELAAANVAAMIRAPRFTDPRRAGRSRRRTHRATLRALPTALAVVDLDGEAA